MSALKVGDEVMLCSVNHKARKTRVARVGRKYIRVEGDPSGDYCLDSLVRHDAYQHEYLLTPADHERRLSIEAACSQLETFGIQLQYGARGSRDLAPEILAAVLPVLTPTREADGKL